MTATAELCGHRWDAPHYPGGWLICKCELPAGHDGDHESPNGERHPTATTRPTEGER